MVLDSLKFSAERRGTNARDDVACNAVINIAVACATLRNSSIGTANALEENLLFSRRRCLNSIRLDIPTLPVSTRQGAKVHYSLLSSNETGYRNHVSRPNDGLCSVLKGVCAEGPIQDMQLI
jgi:hypothetical protein